ncbi:TD and POZ domain-containing protein 4-like [Leptopilina heterotoma]|uniref:TD and POZ domain-containing protein 4-like n=1 Tax=Leptopilina heterotoma TaxID=63436 RepID=UPI001CA90364|nr:TD and POZ domain-containing protein 4-like [Leptopilina heterotoma]
MDEDRVNFFSRSEKANETKNYTSKMKFHHYQLNWMIEDFELMCKSVKIIESPRFPSKDLFKCQWFLEFKPTKLSDRNINEFQFFLKSTNNKEKYVNAEITFHNSQSVVYSLVSYVLPMDYENPWSISGSEFREKFGKAVPKNVLVKCKLSVFDSLTTIEEEPPVKRRKCNDIIENFSSLLSNENFKDVTFKVEEKEFTAHKAILATQSSVFAAMFNSKMSEELTSIVEIKDIKPKTFQQMLNFIYNIQVEDLDELALELFHVAEKYHLEDLKINCVNNLKKNLSLKTVIKTLEMADLYSLFDLKSECLKLLLKEWEAVHKSEELDKLIEDRPYLVIEVVNMRKNLDKKEDVSNNSTSVSCILRN